MTNYQTIIGLYALFLLTYFDQLLRKIFFIFRSKDKLNLKKVVKRIGEFLYIDITKRKDITMSQYNPTTAKELREYLADYPDDAKITAVIWGEDDIRMMNQDDDFNGELDDDFNGELLTDEQVTKVLHDISYYHDAEQGINWDTIRYHVEEVKKK
jgi:hypothetical protein